MWKTRSLYPGLGGVWQLKYAALLPKKKKKKKKERAAQARFYPLSCALLQRQ